MDKARKDMEKLKTRAERAEQDLEKSDQELRQAKAELSKLQKEHRSMQAELNKLKAEVDEKVADEKKAMNGEMAADLQLWTEARKAERLKYDEAVKALKVVIPQNLLGVYEKVKAVL